MSFKGDNPDEVLDSLLTAEVDVTDVESENGSVTVFAPPAEFFKAKQALMEAFPDVDLDYQEIAFLPQATKEISPDDVAQFEKFITMLNDCEDVQEIYHNAVVPEQS